MNSNKDAEKPKNKPELSKKPNLDDPTRQIAERLLNMPPKLHKDMKLGKSKAKDANLAFKTTQSKGRASKNET
jgi:hypothetical protein